MTKKTPLSDDSIRVLKTALRTKLGISGAKPKKKAKKREEEVEEIDDDPPPRRQKMERLGYADMVSRRQ